MYTCRQRLDSILYSIGDKKLLVEAMKGEMRRG